MMHVEMSATYRSNFIHSCHVKAGHQPLWQLGVFLLDKPWAEINQYAPAILVNRKDSWESETRITWNLLK